jgi:hypothetical protein
MMKSPNGNRFYCTIQGITIAAAQEIPLHADLNLCGRKDNRTSASGRLEPATFLLVRIVSGGFGQEGDWHPSSQKGDLQV